VEQLLPTHFLTSRVAAE